MSINTKELNKLIKKAAKNSLSWTVSDGHHYITNRHWMVRYKTLPRDVLITMFGVFAEIPEEGMTFNLYASFDGFQKVAAVKFDSIYADFAKAVKGEVTPFLKDNGSMSLRVVKLQGEVAYINEDYMKIIEDIELSEPVGTGTFKPVFFRGGDIVILPYRVTESKDDRTLKELLAS